MHQRIRAFVAAGLVAIALVAGSAAAVAPPATPAGTQLAWLLGALNTSSTPTDAELEQHFSAAFLAQVPPQTLLAALEPVWAGRPVRLTSVTQQGALALKAQVATKASSYRITLVTAASSTHLIEGLLVEPVVTPLAGWPEIDAALRKLGAHATLYAGTAEGRTVHSLHGNDVGAIGSAFKLYVLGALAQAVRNSTARWDEQLAIRDAWKSLPSGAMRTASRGARFTLRHYAEQMISVSDNTAADHLVRRLGRPSVEAQLAALGNHAKAGNRPFLTTREMFALKLAAPVSLRGPFVHGGAARRRELLRRVDSLVPTLAQAERWTEPRQIDTIEWFASPADLGQTIARLVRLSARPGLAPVRAILAINPGISFPAATWSYVGFKGGSEPGVLCMTWYLERKDGSAFVLSIVVDDSRHGIDTGGAISIATAAARLLGVAQ